MPVDALLKIKFLKTTTVSAHEFICGMKKADVLKL